MASREEEIARLLVNSGNGRTSANSNSNIALDYGSTSTTSTSAIINESQQQQQQESSSNSINIEEETSTSTGNNNNNNDNINDNDFLSRTRQRLRCLFILFTCPIIPLVTSLTILLLYIIYLSIFIPEEDDNDNNNNNGNGSCTQPLRSYAFISTILFLYTPYHNKCKRFLSNFVLRDIAPDNNDSNNNESNENSSYNRSVQSLHRIYDHLYLTLCLAYIYLGVEWTENCRLENDVSSSSSLSTPSSSNTTIDTTIISLCNCPLLYHATRSYVLTLCALATVLALPLLCLPCVYFWIIRGAAADALQASTSHLHTSTSTSNNVNIDDILDKMLIVTSSSLSSVSANASNAKECCVCMMEFDYDASLSNTNTNNKCNKIIMTKCNHMFHYDCLKGWMSGSGGGNNANRNNYIRRSCPLCRADLGTDHDDVV